MRIQKRLQGSCSHTTDGGRGFGYSVGYWYIASISGESSESTVYLIATEGSYKALTRDMDEPLAEANEYMEEVKPKRSMSARVVTRTPGGAGAREMPMTSLQRNRRRSLLRSRLIRRSIGTRSFFFMDHLAPASL